MLSDFKYGLRQMRKSPGFTVIAVLILGLGIGVSTAGFNLIDAVLLRALPVRDPGRLVLASTIRPRGTGSKVSEDLSYPTYELLRDQAHSLAGVAAAERYFPSLVASSLGQHLAVPVSINLVSGNFFSVLGVPAFSGRTLVPDDDRKGAPRAVAVLSYAFWQRNFGADAQVVGKTVLLNQVPFVVVGIAQPGFFGFEPGQVVDLWAPVQSGVLLNPTTSTILRDPFFNIYQIIGRLQPGVKLDSAHAELDAIYQGQANALGVHADRRAESWGKIDLTPGGSGRLRLGLDHSAAGIQQLLVTLMVVVGLVLIISCANVGSLLLARTAGRQREFAVRAALGAARGRLARQLVVEGLLLSIAGGGLGLLTTGWFTQALASSFVLGPEGASSIDASINLGSDGRVLLFAVAVSAITGIFVGLIPALKFSQIDLIAAVKAQNSTLTGGSRQRMSRALVVGQIGVSVCLLVGAGLLIRSLQALRNADPGYNRNNLLFVTVDYSSYRLGHLAKDLIVGSETTPGIRSATTSMEGANGGNLYTSLPTAVSVDAPYVYRPQDGMEAAKAYSVFAGPRYFESMGISLVRGRDFTFADIFPGGGTAPISAPVAVISESTALKLFGSADPIGHYIGSPLLLSGSKAKIVGVARNTRWGNLRDNNRLVIFIPSTLSPRRNLTLVLRTEGNPLAMAQSIYALIKRIDPDAHIMSPLTMEDIADRQLFQERIAARVSGFCSVFALTLACLGLYGLLSYNVAQRTREIGVRMALGAQAGSIVSLVVGQAMRLALLGCAIGVAGATALAHFIASRLYGVGAVDPLTLVGTVAALVVVAFLACWLPARRATKVDPMVALRAE